LILAPYRHSTAADHFAGLASVPDHVDFKYIVPPFVTEDDVLVSPQLAPALLLTMQLGPSLKVDEPGAAYRTVNVTLCPRASGVYTVRFFRLQVWVIVDRTQADAVVVQPPSDWLRPLPLNCAISGLEKPP